MARTAYVGSMVVSYNYDENQSNKCWVDASAVLLEDDDSIPLDGDGNMQAGVSIPLDYGDTESSAHGAITAFIRGRWNDQSIQVVFL